MTRLKNSERGNVTITKRLTTPLKQCKLPLNPISNKLVIQFTKHRRKHYPIQWKKICQIMFTVGMSRQPQFLALVFLISYSWMTALMVPFIHIVCCLFVVSFAGAVGAYHSVHQVRGWNSACMAPCKNTHYIMAFIAEQTRSHRA